MWRILIAVGLASLLVEQRVIAQENRDEHSVVFRLAPLDEKREPPVVTAMALSPDHIHLAVAGDDHAIRIVRLDTQEIVATLLGHTDWVKSLDYSKDGKWLASCGNDCCLRIWEINAGYRGRLLAKTEHALSIVRIHPNQDSVFVAGFSQEVSAWSMASNQKIFSHRCECADHRALDLSEKGDLIAWGGRDGKVVLFDLEQNSVVFERPFHKDRVRCIRFSPDGTRICSIGEDRRICRWDIPTESMNLDQKIPGGKLMSMIFVDMVTAAIGSSDNAIHFHSTIDGPTGKLLGHRGTISILCCDDKKLISSGYDTSIRIWEMSDVWDRLESDPNTAISSKPATSEKSVR